VYARVPSRLLVANYQVIEEMKHMSALSKPLIVSIDWHGEVYYGDPNATILSRISNLKEGFQGNHKKGMRPSERK
jgi:hypothetical protein